MQTDMKIPKYCGDSAFQALLDILKVGRPVAEVRAAIFVSLFSADQIQPDETLARLLASGPTIMPRGAGKDFALQFLALWEELIHNFELSNSLKFFPVDLVATRKALTVRVQCRVAEANCLMQIFDFDIIRHPKLGDLLSPVKTEAMRNIERLACMADKLKGGGLKALASRLEAIQSALEAIFNGTAEAIRQDRRHGIESLHRYKQFLLDHKHVGRNEPCPCGSERKYKKCCLNGPDLLVTVDSTKASAGNMFSGVQ